MHCYEVLYINNIIISAKFIKGSMDINKISDTSYWTAAVRAVETKRSDSIFKDEVAIELIDSKEEEILASIPNSKKYSWGIVTRTKIMDDYIEEIIEKENIDTVLNLGAGLDTRPYRLNLPIELNWVEVDFQHIINFKNEKLCGHTPICNLKRIPLDLHDYKHRKTLLKNIDAKANKVLVVSEGLLVYLSEEEVNYLATDLSKQDNFCFWLYDISTPTALEFANNIYKETLEKANMKMQFALPQDKLYFDKYNFHEHSRKYTNEQAYKLNRYMKISFIDNLKYIFLTPKEEKERYRKMHSVVLLQKN